MATQAKRLILQGIHQGKSLEKIQVSHREVEAWAQALTSHPRALAGSTLHPKWVATLCNFRPSLIASSPLSWSSSEKTIFLAHLAVEKQVIQKNAGNWLHLAPELFEAHFFIQSNVLPINTPVEHVHLFVKSMFYDWPNRGQEPLRYFHHWLHANKEQLSTIQTQYMPGWIEQVGVWLSKTPLNFLEKADLLNQLIPRKYQHDDIVVQMAVQCPGCLLKTASYWNDPMFVDWAERLSVQEMEDAYQTLQRIEIPQVSSELFQYVVNALNVMHSLDAYVPMHLGSQHSLDLPRFEFD